MAEYYKRIDNQEQKNRPSNAMSVNQSEKVQKIVKDFVYYFKNA